MPGTGLHFPRKIDLARTPTPLQYLERASARWGRGHRLWMKRDDLTGCTLSGNKVRKLEYIAAHAQDGGYDTLITCGGIQSNHCRATAFVGAQLGMPVHLVLRGKATGTAQGNLFLDHLAGATVSHYPTAEYVKGLDSILDHWQSHYAQQGRKALVIPTGGSDGLGVWGYLSAALEIATDLHNARIDRAHLVCASGSGGTQAGLTLGAALFAMPATVWGVNVCDDEQYFLNKVAADVADWQARYPAVPQTTLDIRVLDGYVGDGYGRASAAVFDLIAQLARLEGIVLDPVYTGKAFGGMIAEIEQGRFEGTRDIVFVHTGGIFGVFPQSGSFNW
ncbi:1-aminocyclopropane-1-carboxylate deaminase/D-cysteine desulfhydrase [Pseudohalioglobus lutimaris]|uniref:D-cysteine desulfhydrase family protein n=1 Tax=Pseudohalioglobus lutimaris TaxID=1737061 RepID=A0A2N5WXB5_9GAMM|nr:D-cysteine desulfhydrase family protein [Pseudohalioglobus lutimaris]PLW66882.1 D-cysteine desulfhydrase family protein [Pseudohalioglobus lutimaris]